MSKLSTKISENGWYTREYIMSMGFKSLGKNVLISDKCSIYGVQNISIGDNVRIDDFCVLSAVRGSLLLEGYNHISSFCYLNASGGVTLKAFSGLSSRCSLYSSSDTYDGTCLTNPTVPDEYTSVYSAPIVLGRHAIVGTNSSILPGCSLGDGAAVGAFSLVIKNIGEFKVAVGIPAKEIKDRSRDLLELEEKCLKK